MRQCLSGWWFLSPPGTHSSFYLVSSAQAPPMRLSLRETKSLPMVIYSQRQMESRLQLSWRQEIEDVWKQG